MKALKKVKSYQDACKRLQLDPKEIEKLSTLPEGFREPAVAYYKLSIIIKALNEGWTPDWNDESQPKYFPIFNMQDKPGFGFIFYNNWTYCSTSGSPLALKSSQLAEYVGKQFEAEYKALLKPNTHTNETWKRQKH